MTLEMLKKSRRVTGIKQVSKKVQRGEVECVFIASDADARVTAPLLTLCQEAKIEVVNTATMDELGEACSIEVGASAAAILG